MFRDKEFLASLSVKRVSLTVDFLCTFMIQCWGQILLCNIHKILIPDIPLFYLVLQISEQGLGSPNEKEKKKLNKYNWIST